MRKFAIALTLCFVASAAVQAQLNPVPMAPEGWDSDGTPTIVYDSINGTWDVDFDDVKATTLELTTTGGDFFTGGKPADFVGLFDVYNATKAFKLDPAGFSDVVGGTAVAGITPGDASNLLVANGSRLGGGNIAPIDLHVIAIPEPSSIVLAFLGGLALLARRRK